MSMRKITLEAQAGEVSAELARRGLSARTRVHVVVEVVSEETEFLCMASLCHEGGAFDWLAREPDLYSDADIMDRPVRGSS